MLILIAIVVWGIIELIFFATHRKPLTDVEIHKLMEKRKKKYIKINYTFSATNSYPDKNFKSSLCPSGKLYSSNIALAHFPSYASNLLKGKKHEWVVLACVKDTTVKCFYANKGDDNQSVTFNVEMSDLVALCHKYGYQTIMRFHNHPNGDPAHYTCLLASKQDRMSANHLSKIANDNNINWLDFVCERGNFIIFSSKFSTDFYPEKSSYEYISNENVEGNYYRIQRELGIFR